MPFYLTNENIEATMERNPDDIFNPSDTNHKPQNESIIRRCFFQAIIQTFKKQINKEVEFDGFKKVENLQEKSCQAYLLKIETTLDEYELVYHLSSKLLTLLQESETFLLELSNSIIDLLNAEELSYLEDIELVELSQGNEAKENSNLYTLHITIDKDEYAFYLELDSQFSKIF